MILQEEAHVWQIKLDVKGAPSTSMHCGRALTETICCNTEITNVISVFDNMIVSVSFKKVSQPAISLGCEDTGRFSNTIRTFVISV